MIQQLANKYRTITLSLLLTANYATILSSAYAVPGFRANDPVVHSTGYTGGRGTSHTYRNSSPVLFMRPAGIYKAPAVAAGSAILLKPSKLNGPAIGGPSQPEMSAFKSINADNMVNLFTGDFSYNIPLMDVGGYPVNIFYNGDVGMEQDASWVGLGWNINPGNVNRNMRGIPDDFNGEEKLKQTQQMKPNENLGVGINADFEFVGLKGLSFGSSWGVSMNNYLGPALEIGMKGSYSFNVGDKAGNEKTGSTDSVTASLSLGATFNSRSGLNVSPYVSLSAQQFNQDKKLMSGNTLGLGTSYNSRNGIRELQISEQSKFNLANSLPQNPDKDMPRNEGGTWSISPWSSTISFAKPSYIPSIRMPISNSSFASKFEVGWGMYGVIVDLELDTYGQRSSISRADEVQYKPMVGYLNYQKAVANRDAVMDFTRFNDNEVLDGTPIISAPQYTYDVFNVQGEGTGGVFRFYRNDQGHVRDNFVRSRDISINTGFDLGIPGHYGGNINLLLTPTTAGDWNSNNKLNQAKGFGFGSNKGAVENVYLRNPGETGVIVPGQYDKIGGTSLVRFKLGRSRIYPSIEPSLEKFDRLGKSEGTFSMAVPDNTERKKRTQVISYLSAKEASEIGLDKTIKSYDSQNLLDASNNLNYTSIPRVDGTIRKEHHISQINITEADGSRYVYGIPVYNLSQKDLSFSVAAPSSVDAEKTTFNADEITTNSPYLSHLPSNKKDGYLQITETPAYAHSFLLSGLLSPDYVDITGDGITDDDQGGAVKFNYTHLLQNNKWRTPMDNMQANFNPGKRTEQKDDKGIISSGERESWYLHSIESKTMIAVFTLENRADGKGVVTTDFGGLNTSDNSQKRLKKIDLYSKADLKKNGLAGAKPVKTVNFKYSYSLCSGSPNNNGVAEMNDQNVNVNAAHGKLTLEGIYFTYNGQQRSNKDRYVFSYTNGNQGNPAYAFNGMDRWGVYKSAADNPASIRNADYPYTIQDKTKADANAGAWLLKKVLLPSGGQLEVNYESDDYAYVQNKRAAAMMQVVGFGSTPAAYSNHLYDINGSSIDENDYVFIQVPGGYSNNYEMYTKYLEGIDQVALRLAVNMPKSNEMQAQEYINTYATIAKDAGPNYGMYQGNPSTKIIWIKMERVDGHSPLILSCFEFLREQLPGQAHNGYDVSEASGIAQIGQILSGMLDGLLEAFHDQNRFFMQRGKAQEVVTAKCFARLNTPNGFKYGGGVRVKSVKIKDNWKRMNNGSLFNSEYGQEYDYTTKEMFNGSERTISSGVASYEPSLGGDENPFHTMFQVADRVPLGPTSYGAIEMPFLDAFFPAPSVGYSKVTVRTIRKGDIDPSLKTRSGIGKQVTEFYTAKDFPVTYMNTPLDEGTDLKWKKHANVFFYHYSGKSRAISQGFLVETNDMHGKMKSQTSYAETDEKTPVSYTENFYRNTGEKGLDEKFDFADGASGGTITKGNMGVDIELMTDAREYAIKTTGIEIQAQVDWFQLAWFSLWLPFVWPVVSRGNNTYRAVTTTKVVNYHSIVDSIVVIDKGSQVTTKNLVFDAETGNVIVSRTNNMHNDPVYKTNYPAYWAYSGMGLAYKNIDAVYTATFHDGVTTDVQPSAFESGDELYILDPGKIPTDACAAQLTSSASIKQLWVVDKNKNRSSLTNTNPDYIFIDADGYPYTRDNVTFRIVRSGHRNMLGADAASFTSMVSPINDGKLQLISHGDMKVINATAVEYKEKWQTDNEQFKRYNTVFNPANCTYTEVADCNGHLEKNINPYRKGLLGNFKTSQSRVFYGSRQEQDPSSVTNLRNNGFLENFGLFWDFNSSNNLVPDLNNSKWVWNSQITKQNAKGMELETKDAMGIYTSAQYGFDKTLPTAIANNARYNEMGAEGFEDNEYNATLNPVTQSTCYRNHIDFKGMANSSIINTQGTAISAHTGKYVLQVNANSTAQKTFTIGTQIYDDFDMTFKQSAKLTTASPYIFSQKAGSVPASEPDPGIVTFTSGGQLGMQYKILTALHHHSPYLDYNPTTRVGSFSAFYQTRQYAKVPVSGNFTFSMNAEQVMWEDHLVPDENQIPPTYNSSGLMLRIKKANGDLVYQKQLYSDEGHPDPMPWSTSKNTSFTVYLECGDYIFETMPSSYMSLMLELGWPTMPNGLGQGLYNFYSTASFGCMPPIYTYAPGCAYTQPIPGDEAMLTSPINLTPGKKMIFSAWVKENCTTPCTQSTYNNTAIQLEFNDMNSTKSDITPVGPIIEGWQKIEKEFTVPEGATSMTVKFKNQSGQPAYFDDIRIHPFNANMKTYVYDPVNLRLAAELDANNFASYYEYDEEGTLIRVKAETKEGVKTIRETRSAKQKNINTIE